MAAPAITASTRYTARGSTKCYWVASIASKSAPSRAELNAGTDLSSQIMDAEGWSVESEQIETPDLATRYTSTIPGSITAEDSSLTMYASKNGVDARALMPRDAIGHIVWLDGGDITGNKMDVFPVTVSSLSKVRSASGEDADTLVISFAITSEPAESVSVPA
jgi:hypothetical protein